MKSDQSGFTLIELIVAIAILGLVLTISFNFFSFSLRTFNKTELRADLNNNLELATRYITTRVRKADYVHLYPSPSDMETLVEGDNYLFLDNGYLRHVSFDNSINKFQPIFTELIFTRNDPGKNLLTFNITAELKDKSKTFDSKVFLQNLEKQSDFKTSNNPGDNYHLIYYKIKQTTP